MFVEKLTDKQIIDFLCQDNKDSDININTVISIEGYRLCTVEIPSNEYFKQQVITLNDTSLRSDYSFQKLFNYDNLDWKRYLYSIFGKEYKDWYIQKQQEELKSIFE